MEHPLIGNIDELDAEALLTKINELNRKFSIAYNLGNHDLCNQLRMAIESYQNKYNEKMRPKNGNDDFGNIIDIS